MKDFFYLLKTSLIMQERFTDSSLIALVWEILIDSTYVAASPFIYLNSSIIGETM